MHRHFGHEVVDDLGGLVEVVLLERLQPTRVVVRVRHEEHLQQGHTGEWGNHMALMGLMRRKEQFYGSNGVNGKKRTALWL